MELEFEALNLIYRYDLIAITESALHKSSSNDEIQLDGSLAICMDLLDDASHDGVLLYYRDNLAVRERPELKTFSNMKVCELTINKKKVIVSVTYSKHHNSKIELETFIDRYKEMCKHALHIGDLNCHSSEFWNSESGHGVQFDLGNLLVCVLNGICCQQLVHLI